VIAIYKRPGEINTVVLTSAPDNVEQGFGHFFEAIEERRRPDSLAT
jgi:hypothetical protein